jgi:hypothetical protein
MEASTMCSGGTCDEFATERIHLGFVYSRPDSKTLLSDGPERPIRVLVRAESMDLSQPDDTTRQRLTEDLRSFLAPVQLGDLTGPYSR